MFSTFELVGLGLLTIVAVVLVVYGRHLLRDTAAEELAAALKEKQIDSVIIRPEVVARDPRHGIARVILFSGTNDGKGWKLFYTDGKSNNDDLAPAVVQDLFRRLTYYESGEAMEMASYIRRKYKSLGIELDQKALKEGWLKLSVASR